MSNGIPQQSPPLEPLPLVSIVLPVWNPQPEWLAEAIDSAFYESGCQIEVVLVDDGSDLPPDAWLSPHDADRVRLFRTPHHGVSHARNVALEHCRGEFIRFLDGDDVILPESTSTLLKLAYGDQNVITYGSTILCDSNLRLRGSLRSQLQGRIYLHTALGRFRSMFQAMLIPHKLAVEVGGFNERLIVYGDWDFVLRLSEVADFRGTQEPVYLLRQHEGSLSSGRLGYRKAVRSTAIIIKGFLSRHPELQGTRVERKLRAHAQFKFATLLYPDFPMRSSRYWKATAVDPARGLVIAGKRMVALGKKMMGRIWHWRNRN